jgi:hypothetical protein
VSPKFWVRRMSAARLAANALVVIQDGHFDQHDVNDVGDDDSLMPKDRWCHNRRIVQPIAFVFKQTRGMRD